MLRKHLNVYCGHLLDKYRDASGALSLLFLIILPTLMLILFSFFANAQVDRDELDYIRACQNELDLTLSDYDRQLRNEFGLWGTDLNALNQNQEMLNSSYNTTIYNGSYHTTRTIRATGLLEDKQNFKKQIINQMTYRAPAFLLDEVLSRYTDYQKLGEKLSSIEAFNLSQFTNPKDVLDNPEDYKGESSDLNLEFEGEEENSEHELSSEEKSKLASLALDLLNEKIDDVKLMIVPIYESAGVDMPQDPLAPNAITSLANSLDSFFIHFDFPILDNILMHEYLFSYYTMHTPRLEMKEGEMYLYTPDGRKHADLVFGGREHEVEQVIFDKNEAKAAYSASKNMITGLTFVYHLVDKATDQTKQNIYLAEATALSTTIAIASAGTVIIEPQSLTYLFMLIDIIGHTYSDLNNILAGKLIQLSFVNWDIKLNYKDFMRIFLIFKTENGLLEGMTRLRQNTINKEFAVSFALDGQFEGKSFSMSRAFSDYKED